MSEFLRQLMTGIQDAWKRLSINAKVQIGLSTLIAILLLGGSVYMGAKPDYIQAFSNLDLAESNTIQTWLTDEGIAFRQRGGGTIIDVDANNVSRARVALAAQGIPRSQGIVPGMELFDKPDMMTNKFLQDVDLARAYNGELQRQLNMFEFVRNSTVFIHKAERSFFRTEQEPAEAAVTLDVVGGSLTKEQIKAVVHLVSTYGGANLTRNGITITNTKAEVLHSPIRDEFTALASDRLGNKVELETHLENKIENMFAKFNRQATVTVSAHLDWSAEQTTKKVLGEAKPVATLTSETTSKTTDSADALAPGVTANADLEGGATGGIVNETSDSETIENNEMDETVTTTTLPPGRTKMYSVTAVIEGDYDDAGEYLKLSDDKIKDFTQAITNAVGEGIEASNVFVMDQPFKVSNLSLPEVAVASSFLTSQVFKQIVQFVLIVITFILLRIFIRRAMVLPTVEEEEVIEMPTMSAEELHAQNVADEVARLSREEPETVAALLRNWMSEEQ